MVSRVNCSKEIEAFSGRKTVASGSLKTYDTFAAIGQTILANFGLQAMKLGTSFLKEGDA